MYILIKISHKSIKSKVFYHLPTSLSPTITFGYIFPDVLTNMYVHSQKIVLFSFYILVFLTYISVLYSFYIIHIIFHFMLFNNQCILEPFSCQYILVKGCIVLIFYRMYERNLNNSSPTD